MKTIEKNEAKMMTDQTSTRWGPWLVLAASGLVVWPGAVFSQETGDLSSPAPKSAALYFIQPADGEVVESPFVVKFGLRGMGVAPAGINMANTGHHHLLVDHSGEVDLDGPLPANDQVRHFGGGQTETAVTLSPGTHTLKLVLGNHLHVPHTPAVMSDEITVTVK